MSDKVHIRNRSKKATTLVLVVVATASASGYFMGLRQNLRQQDEAPEWVREVVEPEAHPAAPTAPSYLDLIEREWAAHPHPGSILREGVLPSAAPALEPKDRAALAARRLEHRAFEGAPPIIPHSINEMTPAACAVCHTTPTRIGDAIAPAMSHEPYASCTQCHVAADGPRIGLDVPPLPDGQPPFGSDFAGLDAHGAGQRNHPYAPPMIPHPIKMRENCISCHGAAGSNPLPQSHPVATTDCLQCHAADARGIFPWVVDYLRDFSDLAAEIPDDPEP